MNCCLIIQVLICINMAQESWEVLYTNFQANDPKDAEGWTIKNNYSGNIFSTCNGYTLFGGYNAFGMNTIVSKVFNMPPHYKVKITLQFWKIDSWDNEYGYIITEDAYWLKSYIYWQGSQLCGSGYNWHEVIEPILFIMNHQSESLIFIATSSLDQQAQDESWAIRDLVISILRCPLGCVFCSDNDINNCYFWIGHLSLWHQSVEFDGWIKNDNIQPSTSQCVNINLAGGYLELRPNDKIEKLIENLIPHYQAQIVFQLWRIDSWNNEMFFLDVDDQIYHQEILETTGIYSICGSNSLEKIINIGINLSHSKKSIKITIRTNHNSITANAYWGIRAFNLYLAKCINGCDQCFGPLKSQCIVCSNDWVFVNNLCTYPTPMYFSQIQITQMKDPNSDARISMEINLIEANQKIKPQGNFTLSVKNNKSKLTIEVYVKCFLKKKIKSQFQSKTPDDLQEYKLQQNCQGPFNSIIYNVTYQLSIVADQEFIINKSDTKCLIYQILKVVDEFTLQKILEIVLEDV